MTTMHQPTTARRLVATTPGPLLIAVLLGGAGQSVAGAAGALIAGRLGGDSASGLPQGALVLGSGAAALGISWLTRHRGRGPALALGLAVAAGGAALVALGALGGSLLLVVLGSLVLGAGNAAIMLSRYAAAALAEPSARARAMGVLLAATTLGAVAGPNLMAPTDRLGQAIGWAPYAGSYVASAIGFLAAAAAMLGVPRDARTTEATGSTQREPWTRSARSGLVVLAAANLVMVSVMTAAPMHLHDHHHGLAMIGLVISLHIAGMFAPSPISGWLTDRYGAVRTTRVAGAVLVLACVLAAGYSDIMPLFAVAMAALGAGWNLALVSGSELLVRDLPEARRPTREGEGEAGMAVTAAVGGVGSGLVLAAGGYPLVAMAGLVVALVVGSAAGVRRPMSAASGMSQDDHHDHAHHPHHR